MMIRIFGDPRPQPKLITGHKQIGGRTVSFPLKQDFRKRTVVDPITGDKKMQRYDIGYCQRWFDHVRQNVLIWMEQNGRQPFEHHHPIALGCLFFIRKPKTSKLVYPTGTPDFDNLDYGITNILKRTPDIKRGKIPGPHPEGVAFYDDDQVIWTANPDGVLWATQSNPPGVLITIIDLLQHLDMLDWGRDIDKDMCAEVVALGKEVQFG